MDGGNITVSSSGFTVRTLVLAIWTLLRCWSRLRRNTYTLPVLYMHLLVQRRRAYSHVLRWLSRDRNSPTHPHFLSQLSHLTVSDLISHSPICRKKYRRVILFHHELAKVHSPRMSGKFCPVFLQFGQVLECFLCSSRQVLQ